MVFSEQEEARIRDLFKESISDALHEFHVRHNGWANYVIGTINIKSDKVFIVQSGTPSEPPPPDPPGKGG